ncbi:MAG: hypothetical protein ACHREM_00535 [Polyangiales bacterium]
MTTKSNESDSDEVRRACDGKWVPLRNSVNVTGDELHVGARAGNEHCAGCRRLIVAGSLLVFAHDPKSMYSRMLCVVCALREIGFEVDDFTDPNHGKHLPVEVDEVWARKSDGRRAVVINVRAAEVAIRWETPAAGDDDGEDYVDRYEFPRRWARVPEAPARAGAAAPG